MKTRNSKLQKAGFETLTAMAILVTTCFTINAQGAGYKGSLTTETELASIEAVKYAPVPSAKAKAKAEMVYFAEYLNEDREEELAVENWMTDATYFEVADLTSDLEEAMKVEEWMLDDNYFESVEETKEDNQATTVKENKKPKTIGVTFPAAQFGRRAFILVEMEDPELELEAWMFDQKIWNTRK